MVYADRPVPLGFAVKLNRFRMGFYPGGERPRSFESHITISDLSSGKNFDRIISMNHPVSYGGYTFYQSSYRYDSGRAISYLSVARDPGQTVVFAGYILTIAGMLTFLVQRAWDRRRRESKEKERETKETRSSS